MSESRSMQLGFVGVVLLLAGAARADSVPAPPDGCPSGSIGVTGHAGPMCAPDRCESNRRCGPAALRSRPPGRVCRAAAFCVEERSLTHRGLPLVVRRWTGACAADGSCAEGVCERGDYCVDPPPPTPPPTAPPPDESGCRASPSGSQAGWLVLALVLGRRRPKV